MFQLKIWNKFCQLHLYYHLDNNIKKLGLKVITLTDPHCTAQSDVTTYIACMFIISGLIVYSRNDYTEAKFIFVIDEIFFK